MRNHHAGKLIPHAFDGYARIDRESDKSVWHCQKDPIEQAEYFWEEFLAPIPINGIFGVIVWFHHKGFVWHHPCSMYLYLKNIHYSQLYPPISIVCSFHFNSSCLFLFLFVQFTLDSRFGYSFCLYLCLIFLNERHTASRVIVTCAEQNGKKGQQQQRTTVRHQPKQNVLFIYIFAWINVCTCCAFLIFFCCFVFIEFCCRFCIFAAVTKCNITSGFVLLDLKFSQLKRLFCISFRSFNHSLGRWKSR